MKKYIWDLKLIGEKPIQVKSASLEPGTPGTLVFLNGKTSVEDVVLVVNIAAMQYLERTGSVEE